MNRTVVTVVAILATAGLVGLYLWVSHNRFYVVAGDRGLAYEIDRKTGKSWMLLAKQKIAQRSGNETQCNEQELPNRAASKVTGSASISLGYFSGKIYNGSDWTVTRIVINIEAKEQDGTVRWSRDFSESLNIAPLTTESFSISVSGENGVRDAPWMIRQVLGCNE